MDVLEPGESYVWYVAVSDGEDMVKAENWTFTVEGSSGGGGGDDDDDDDFEIAGMNGYMVVTIGVSVAVIVVALLIWRSREEEYDEYEDYEEYEEYEEDYL